MYYFDNKYLANLIASGNDVKIHYRGNVYSIPSIQDLKSPVSGVAIDEKGKSIEFDYREVGKIEIEGRPYDIEKLNKDLGSEEKEKPEEEKPEEEEGGGEEPAEEPAAEEPAGGEEEKPKEEPKEKEEKPKEEKPKESVFRMGDLIEVKRTKEKGIFLKQFGKEASVNIFTKKGKTENKIISMNEIKKSKI